MAGFIDKNNRVIDMVLTAHGKRLLSKGQLHFCFWVPFDDDIQYDAIIHESGSLTEEQLSASIDLAIQTTPLREASSGYREFNNVGLDNVNVYRPVFTVAQGQVTIPQAEVSTEPFVINTKQKKVEKQFASRDDASIFLNPPSPEDLGVERFLSTQHKLEMSYQRDSFPSDFNPEGFRISVLKSGSNGFVEVPIRRDLNNDLAAGPELKLFTGVRGR